MSILGLGTCVIDRVVVLERYPDADTKQPILDSWVQVGGPVPVALATVASLGAKTRLMTRRGLDANGNLIEQTLAARGIDLRFVESQSGWNSGEAQIWISQQEATRTIAFDRGGFPAMTEADVKPEALDRCRILHLDGWSGGAACAAAARMKEQGGTVVLDAGSMKPGILELMPFVDVLIASQLFRIAHQKETGRELPSSIPAIICTKGAEGASLLTGNSCVMVPGQNVNVVDTNGAGDVFSGAVLFGLTQSWPLLKCVEFANQTAATSCTERGNSLLVKQIE